MLDLSATVPRFPMSRIGFRIAVYPTGSAPGHAPYRYFSVST